MQHPNSLQVENVLHVNRDVHTVGTVHYLDGDEDGRFVNVVVEYDEDGNVINVHHTIGGDGYVFGHFDAQSVIHFLQQEEFVEDTTVNDDNNNLHRMCVFQC